MPGQTREGAMELLALSVRALEQAKAELVDSAMVSPQAMGPPAKRTTGAVGQGKKSNKTTYPYYGKC